MGFIWDFYGIYMGFIWGFILWDLYEIFMGALSSTFEQLILAEKKVLTVNGEVFFCLENHRFSLFLGAMVDFKEVCMRFEWDLHNWFLILSKSIVMYFIGFCTYFEFHLH